MSSFAAWTENVEPATGQALDVSGPSSRNPAAGPYQTASMRLDLAGREAVLAQRVAAGEALQTRQIAVDPLAHGRRLAKGLTAEGVKRGTSLPTAQEPLVTGVGAAGLNPHTQSAAALRRDDLPKPTQLLRSSSQHSHVGWPLRRSETIDALENGMVSRAGAVTMRKMVGATKSLLLNLEDALMHRAGFLAAIFHQWNCEVTLLKMAHHNQEEHRRKRDQWEAALAHRERSFEEELRLAAEAQKKDGKEHARLQHDLLLDKWAHGEKQGLKRQAASAWRTYAKREQGLRRTAASIHRATLTWMEGNSKGTVHACYLAWKHEAHRERAARRHAETEQRHATHVDEMERDSNRRIQEALANMDACTKRSQKEIAFAMDKWMIGDRRSLLFVIFRDWARCFYKSKAGRALSQSVQQSLRKALEGTARGTLHGCFTSWNLSLSHAKDVKQMQTMFDQERALRDQREAELRREHDAAVEAAKQGTHLAVDKWMVGEKKGLKAAVFVAWHQFGANRAAADRNSMAVRVSCQKFLDGSLKSVMRVCFQEWFHDVKHEKMAKKHQQDLLDETTKFNGFLEDQRKQHSTELERTQNEAEQRHQLAKESIALVVAKWELGDIRGLSSAVFREWCAVIGQVKVAGKGRQNVHLALLKAIEGDTAALRDMALRSWKALAKSEAEARRWELRLKDEQDHWEASKQEIIAMHASEINGAQDEKGRVHFQAHAVTELMLRKWMGGEDVGVKGETFAVWRRVTQALAQAKRLQWAALSTVMRCRNSEVQGDLYTYFVQWASTSRLSRHNASQVNALETRVQNLLSNRATVLAKYAVTLSEASDSALAGLIVYSWREVARGAGFFDNERKHEAEVAELRRQHGMATTRRKMLASQFLERMGLKDRRVGMLSVWLAWYYHRQCQKDRWAQKVMHNALLDRYSNFIIRGTMMQDYKGVLAVCFKEWHREGPMLRRQRDHEGSLLKLGEVDLYAKKLEQRLAALEEELWLAYKQIDSITSTVQIELRGKEELATELREAYSRMRMALPGSEQQNPNYTPQKLGGSNALALSTATPTQLGSSMMSMSMSQSASAVNPHSPPKEWSRAAPHMGSNVGSPHKCDWDAVVSRMREEGLMKLEGSGQ